MSTRREVIAGLTATAASPLLPAGAAVRDALDLDDPEVNLRAYVKLRGSLDGEPVFDVVRGQVFGILPGQVTRPLFTTLGAQRSVYARRSALEYAASTRYLGWLLDPASGQVLERWTNPWNGADCAVPRTRYGPSRVRVLADRVLPAADPAEAPVAGRRPWYLLGDIVHMLDEIVLPLPDGSAFPKADLMTFSGRWQDLADPRSSRMPSRLAFSAVEPWRDWMRMEEPGMLWWHVTGVKLAGPGDMPPELLALVQAEDPGFLAGKEDP